MPLPLALAVIAGLVLVYWAIVKGGKTVRVTALSVALAAAFCFGYAIGQVWERLRNYDQYVYQFSQCSRHFRELAEGGQVAELTNDVILFDRRFNASQRASDLQDAMLQVLKVGPYYPGTNTGSR
jgi:hypothetical protein